MPQTADYLLMILFLIPTYVIVSNGLRVLGRYAEFAFYLVLWMPFFYVVALRESFHLLHLLPLLKEGWVTVLKTAKTTGYSFLGFDIAFFLYPFLQKKEKAAIGIVIANTLSMLVFLFVTLFCFVFFSPDQITHYNEPTVSILKVVEFRFIERMEMIFLAFYLFVMSTTWMPYVYCIAFTTSWLFGQKHYRRVVQVTVLAAVIYTFFFIPTFTQNDQWQQWNSKNGLVLGFFFPVFLWMFVSLRDRLQRRRNP